jgi:hypothetical protein
VPSPIRPRERERERVRVRSRSRSGSRSPLRRIRYVDNPGRERHNRSRRSPYDYEEDLDTGQGSYSFRLSRHTKSLFSRDSTVGSLSDISEKEVIPAHQALGNIPHVGKQLHVLHSKYTGEGSIGGSQSAALQVTEDANKGMVKGSQSLFKWV